MPIALKFFFCCFHENSSAYWFLVRHLHGCEVFFLRASCVALFAHIHVLVVACETINTELPSFFLWLCFFCCCFASRIVIGGNLLVFCCLLYTRGDRWRYFGIIYDRLLHVFQLVSYTISTCAPPSYVAQLLMLCVFSSVTSSSWCVLQKLRQCRWMNFQFGLLGLRFSLNTILCFFFLSYLWSIISISAAI